MTNAYSGARLESSKKPVLSHENPAKEIDMLALVEKRELSKEEIILDSIKSVTLIRGTKLKITFNPVTKISLDNIYIFSIYFIARLKNNKRKLYNNIPLIETRRAIRGKTLYVDLSKYKNITRIIKNSDEITFIHSVTKDGITFVKP